jgi:NADPH:quinone reductase-like Zn-dependent oxidoreductase
MKALVRRSYGDASALQLAEIDTPTPGEGEVLVRVTAAGIDAGAYHFITGEPRLMRLGLGLSEPRDPRTGIELAGVVDAVGPGVSELAVGDAVFGVSTGSFADAVVAKASKLAKLPAGLDPVDAAAAAVSGMTALDALAAAGPLAGQRVLVTGAGGGVGTFIVQLALAKGALVTGVCSTAKVPLVRSLGAEAVNYTRGEPTGQFDVVFDLGGRRPLRQLRGLLVRGGRAVLIGGEGGTGPLSGFERQLFAPLTMALSGRRFISLTSSTTTAKLQRLAERLTRGDVHAVIDRRYPLAEGVAAVRHFESGTVAGKLVLVP